MTFVLYAIAGIVIAFIAFILWRLASVGRGVRQRDAKIAEVLFPLAQKLGLNEPVTSHEVSVLAAQPQVRPMLYGMLEHFKRLDLFPAEYLDTGSQGEARLAYWMMHPNELEDAPEKIELVESIIRKLNPAGQEGTFYVYRYKMPVGHWAGDDWILGLAGAVKPAELIDWYIAMAERKGAPWAKS